MLCGVKAKAPAACFCKLPAKATKLIAQQGWTSRKAQKNDLIQDLETSLIPSQPPAFCWIPGCTTLVECSRCTVHYQQVEKTQSMLGSHIMNSCAHKNSAVIKADCIHHDRGFFQDRAKALSSFQPSLWPIGLIEGICCAATQP